MIVVLVIFAGINHPFGPMVFANLWVILDQENKVCFLFDLVFFELTLRKLIRVNFKYNLFEPTDFFSSFLLEQSWIRKKVAAVCRGISKWCLK
jgi:hypothetical protein